MSETITPAEIFTNDFIIINKTKHYYNSMLDMPIIREHDYKFPHRFEVPVCHVKLINKLIEKALSLVEGTRIYFNEDKVKWEIYFGTEPLLRTYSHDLNLYSIIYRKQLCAQEAASIASNKFPIDCEELEDFVESENPPEPPFSQPRWCKTVIYCKYNESKNTVLIEINRESGDHSGYFLIYKNINEFFQPYKII